MIAVGDFSTGRRHGAQVLNEDLQKIADWARTWLVEFNLDKTELLTVSRKKDVTGHWKRISSGRKSEVIGFPHPVLQFGGRQLAESATVRLLGYTLACNLLPTSHIQKVISQKSTFSASKNEAISD